MGIIKKIKEALQKRKQKKAEKAKKAVKEFEDTVAKIFPDLPRGYKRCTECKKVCPLNAGGLENLPIIINGHGAILCKDCWAKIMAKKEIAEDRQIPTTCGFTIKGQDRALIEFYKKAILAKKIR